MVVLRVERKENIQVNRTKYIENHLEMKKLSAIFDTSQIILNENLG